MADLVARLRSGDADAAEALFNRYAQRLTHLAEQHLSRKLAGRVDGEDIVQSVFRTFFRRSGQGEFHIDNSAQLWKLLVKITVLKARARGRFHSAGQRDIDREHAGEAWLATAAAHEPGPEEAAILVDQIERLLDGLPPVCCHILQLRLEGHPVAEIALRLNLSRQSIYRLLGLLQQRLVDSTPEDVPE
jgi:RNA polymerase sigma-70 factor (ECF subfamily)